MDRRKEFFLQLSLYLWYGLQIFRTGDYGMITFVIAFSSPHIHEMRIKYILLLSIFLRNHYGFCLFQSLDKVALLSIEQISLNLLHRGRNRRRHWNRG